MDPVSQGVLGATVPQALSSHKHILAATLFGAISGMAPDLDSLIRSGSDPLLYLKYHRQFSHSLVFIPLGGLLCALLFHWLIGRRWAIRFGLTYLYCTLGYATHGLLDACTSYGTQLLWPFSTERFAWNTISIIDPLFTVPLLTLAILAFRRRNPRFAQAAVVWIVVYMGFGVYQHERVEAAGYALAAERGHTPSRLEVKPSFANLLVWKVIYEIDTGYVTDAVRAGRKLQVYPGTVIEKLDVARDLPWLDPDSQQARDLERFAWFSKGYLALDPNDPLRVVDMRYSLVPNEGTGLWSIGFTPGADPDAHVTMRPERDTSPPKRAKLARMLRGEDLPR